MHPVIVHRTEK